MSRTKDDELTTMRRIAKTLDAMDVDQRARVMAWLNARPATVLPKQPDLFGEP